MGGIGATGITNFNIVTSFSSGPDVGTLIALAGDQNINIVEATPMLAPANDGREKSNGDILLNTISAGADATAFITTAIGAILNGRLDNQEIIVAG